MPKKISVLMAISIFLFSLSQTRADKVLSLSLDDCLKMVVKNSSEYKIAQMRYQAAEASYNSAKLSYYVPNLTLNFNTPEYSWFGDYQDYYGAAGRVYFIEEYYNYTSSLDLSQKLFTGGDLTVSGLLNSYRRTSNIFTNYDEVRTNLQFNVEQPIFNWNRHKLELDKVRVDYDLSRLKYSEETNQVISDLTTNYIQYLTSQKQLNIAELKVQKVDIDYLSAEKKKEEGLISDMEFAQKRTERMDRKLELLDAKRNFEEYQAKLLQMLRIEEEVELNLNQNIELGQFSLEQERNKNIGQSSEVLKTEGEVRKKELELKEAKASGGIDGKVNFYYGFLGRGPIARESIDNFKKNRWGVSVVLSLPIWDGGAHSSSIRSSQLSLEESKKASELAKAQVKSKLEATVSKLSTAWEKAGFLKEELKLAGDDWTNAQEKNQMGLLSEGQMLDAQITFLETEVKYLNAVLDYKLSRIELDKMWGIVPNFDEK
ncbi:MAG: TolC family protein [candidate division Zixibacteria bacterium]|nr:TolC family protein [candidate division Zixibacteria bacterium]